MEDLVAHPSFGYGIPHPHSDASYSAKHSD